MSLQLRSLNVADSVKNLSNCCDEKHRYTKTFLTNIEQDSVSDQTAARN